MTEIFGLSLGEVLRWFAVALVASSTLFVIGLLLLRRTIGRRPAVAVTPVPVTLGRLLVQIASGVVLMVVLALLLRLVFRIQPGIALIFAGVFGGQLNLLLTWTWATLRQR